jgi:hypothetical protein
MVFVGLTLDMLFSKSKQSFKEKKMWALGSCLNTNLSIRTIHKRTPVNLFIE